MIIGISGKLGCGKDTAAKLIAKNIRKNFPEYNSIPIYKKFFAYKVKLIAELLTGVKMELVIPKSDGIYDADVYDYTQEQKLQILPAFGNMTIGTMLQKIGTDAIRNNLYYDSWIKALYTDYIPQEIKMITSSEKIYDDDGSYLFTDYKYNYSTQYPIWIITDVRFKNEAESVKKHNGKIIHINGDPLDVRKNSTRDLNHQSVIDLDDYTIFDYIIDNNGTLESLDSHINILLTNILKKNN